MSLSEEEYIDKINSMTTEEWNPLLDLIPDIENTENFGEWVSSESNNRDKAIMPFMNKAPVVSEFHKIVYDIPVVIVFDWMRWDEGFRIINNLDFDYDTIDIPDKCKIITTLVRSERFNEGTLVSAFKYGIILKILKSIQKQVI